MPTRFAKTHTVAGPLAGVIAVVMMVLVPLVMLDVDWGTALAVTSLLALQAASVGYLWLVARRGHSRLVETMGMSVALSAAAWPLIYLAAAGVGLKGYAWALLPTLALTTAGVRLQRKSTPVTMPRLAPGDPLALTVMAVCIAWVSARTLPAFTIDGGPGTELLHADLPWYEVLGRATTAFGVGDSGMAAGWPVRYHWLAYAWTGSMTDALNLPLFVSQLRILPVLSLVGVLLLAMTLGRSAKTPAWTPGLAVLLVALGSYVGLERNGTGSLWIWISPSTPMSALWLMALLTVTRLFLIRRMGRPALATIALLSFAAMAGKVSAGAVAVAMLATLCLWGWARRRTWARRAAAAAIVGIASAILTFLLFESGQEAGGALKLATWVSGRSVEGQAASRAQALVLVTGLMIAIGVRWSPALALSISTFRTRIPSVAVWGLVAASLGVLLFIDAPDFTDDYFPLAVGAPVVAIGTVGLGLSLSTNERIIPAERRRRFLISVVVLGLLLSTLLVPASRSNAFDVRPYSLPLMSMIGVLGSAAVVARLCVQDRWWMPRPLIISAAWTLTVISIAFPLGTDAYRALRPQATTLPIAAPMSDAERSLARQWYLDSVQAAQVVRSEADPADVIAVDDATSAVFGSDRWPSALSGLRSLAVGGIYIPRLGPSGSSAEFQRRQSLQRQFLDDPTPARAEALCSEGVRWIWVAPAELLPDSDVLENRGRWPTTALARLKCGAN